MELPPELIDCSRTQESRLSQSYPCHPVRVIVFIIVRRCTCAATKIETSPVNRPMRKNRVNFGLHLNRSTIIVTELPGKTPSTYKCAKVTCRTLRGERTQDEKKHLIAIAHQNAKRCEMINTAEGCMLLLGKMRHCDAHTYGQWEQTGLAASREDRRDKGLPPLVEEVTDVSDDDDVPVATMQAEPGPVWDKCS